MKKTTGNASQWVICERFSFHPQTKHERLHRMIQGMAPGGNPYGLLEVKKYLINK